MHFKNGRAAFEGDQVVMRDFNGKVRAGVLHSLNTGNSLNTGCSGCNGQVSFLLPGTVMQSYVSVGDLYHAEDAFKGMEDRSAANELGTGKVDGASVAAEAVASMTYATTPTAFLPSQVWPTEELKKIVAENLPPKSQV